VYAELDEETTPTYGFQSEVIERGHVRVTFLDLGGGERIRGIWPRYFAEVHGVIFVVDAADYARIDEAKEVFIEEMKDERLMGKPVLV
jgi:GTPase SAR1 family protein